MVTGRNRRVTEIREQALERVKRSLRVRLSRVCSHMPAEQYEALIERMAQVQVKYELRGQPLPPEE